MTSGDPVDFASFGIVTALVIISEIFTLTQFSVLYLISSNRGKSYYSTRQRSRVFIFEPPPTRAAHSMSPFMSKYKSCDEAMDGKLPSHN